MLDLCLLCNLVFVGMENQFYESQNVIYSNDIILIDNVY